MPLTDFCAAVYVLVNIGQLILSTFKCRSKIKELIYYRGDSIELPLT